MTNDRRAQPCVECGWPALLGTRRCPYCRVRMAGAGRSLLRDVYRSLLQPFGGPLRWLVLVWLFGMAPLVLLTVTAFGVLPVATAMIVMLSPLVFLWALYRRSAARIRGLNPPPGHRTHTHDSANRATKG